MSKYQSVTVGVTCKANNTLKASKVGPCASWSSWLSCLQLWHKAYRSGVNDRQLLLAKEVKETKHLFCLVNKQSIQERYQFNYMLLPGPFRTTINFDLSVSIGPKPLQVDAVKYPLCVCQAPSWYLGLLHTNLSSSSLSWLLKGPSLRSQCQWYPGRSIWRWTGEQPTKWPLGSYSSAAWRWSSWQTRYPRRDSMPWYLW